MKKMTPMMQQYHTIKADYKDYILFFRLGDFYEMFFDDAITASKALEITLTKRQAGGGTFAPLCGVPYHSAENYITRLIEKGYKVAICEQTEDPAEAKGIVKREVVRLVTAGTRTDLDALDDKSGNFIYALYQKHNCYGIAYADVTTGDMTVKSYDSLQALTDEFIKIHPSELLIAEDTNFSDLEQVLKMQSTAVTTQHDRYFSNKSATVMIKRTYHVQSLKHYNIEDNSPIVNALGGLLHYISDTQKLSLKHFNTITHLLSQDAMVIDHFTRSNLELTETLRGKEKRGSLLWVIDDTKTAMGGRLLKQWIAQPLLDITKINYRLDAVEFLKDELIIRADLQRLLASIYDFERLLSKAVFGSFNPKDAAALLASLNVLPDIKSLLNYTDITSLQSLNRNINDCPKLKELLKTALKEDPPFSVREGGIFNDGYNDELDALRNIASNGKAWLLDIERKEREATGIKTLKIGYNKVFGYYIEVSKGSVHLVPEYYNRKQTLANAERYILPELKTLEDKILGAEEKIHQLEYKLFNILKAAIIDCTKSLQTTSQAIASLDCLSAFASISAKYNYTRPQLNNDQTITINNGRHPVVERTLNDTPFVSNDTDINQSDKMVNIITGPNMAGKSTYLRQIALISLMAQIGCFVPADKANLSIVDRIFTRVGASDDLFSGQSTFMVEMNELANILNNATTKSLIILDEIGRGTSTFDGLSIAWAVVEHMAEVIKAKTLFATHYHELTELGSMIDGVVNLRILVEDIHDDIIFLRKIENGSANESFGIQVAKLAGVPKNVLARARAVLEQLEANDITKNRSSISSEPSKANANKTQSPSQHPVIQTLAKLDINSLSPIDALLTLKTLKEKL